MEYFASQDPRFNSFYFDLISDPKSYRDFGETGPWLLARSSLRRHWRVISRDGRPKEEEKASHKIIFL